MTLFIIERVIIMNIHESDILQYILNHPQFNVKQITQHFHYSTKFLNDALSSLTNQGYLTSRFHPTQKAIIESKQKTPKNAIILAAGFGMRMVPINTQTPKGLLEVNHEPLIERIIHQLHEVGIYEIYIVVGFMKERFQYLINQYHVHLIENDQYVEKNNLHSMKLVLPYISNSYIIPCDVWCKTNPFHTHELYSWYMVSDEFNQNSNLCVNDQKEVIYVKDYCRGNQIIGISYLLEQEASIVRNNIAKLCKLQSFDHLFWEVSLYQNNHMIVHANVVPANEIIEINTYEQLRDLDHSSKHLKNDAISIITKELHAKEKEITNITVLKKGMTNRSFLFKCHDHDYIMRIPGKGTDQLINRKEEANVYQVIKDKNISDDLIYINPNNGYKITKFLENARVCDPNNIQDVTLCMSFLRSFHQLKLKVSHTFDLYQKIEFYESLWGKQPSLHPDYLITKQHIYDLKPYIEQHKATYCLTHMDAVFDNFLFYPHQEKEELRLIDWEYAAMQDPCVDIAMFAIYALYNKEQIDTLIDIYFKHNTPLETRINIYCYIAVCGLLWSNWCEYKQHLGIEFGDYSTKQYAYAKEFYKIAVQEIEKLNN